MNLREKKKQFTRQSIIDTARALFAEKGYQRTTTSEIARTIGIAEGTLFNYYRTKADLFIAAMLPDMDDDTGIGEVDERTPVMTRLDVTEWSKALVSIIDRRLNGLAAVDKSVLKEYFSMVFGGAGSVHADEKTGLLRSDEHVMQDLRLFFRTQRSEHHSLAEFPEDAAVQSIFSCVVYHLSLYVLDDALSYTTMLTYIEDQIAFMLEGHL